jgi:hypothetical protein
MATQEVPCTSFVCKAAALETPVSRGKIYGIVGLGNKLTCGLCDAAPDTDGNTVTRHGVGWEI